MDFKDSAFFHLPVPSIALPLAAVPQHIALIFFAICPCLFPFLLLKANYESSYPSLTSAHPAFSERSCSSGMVSSVSLSDADNGTAITTFTPFSGKLSI